MAPFVVISLLVWAGGVAIQRAHADPAHPSLTPWQQSFQSIPEASQRLYRSLREGVLEAENLRAQSGQWPSPEVLASAGIDAFSALKWELRQQGIYASYVGVGGGQRWLLVFIEPDPRALPERAPPEDEEHHTLPDARGTGVHITVWTQSDSGELPPGVLAFPVAEGWTQVVGR